MSKLPYFPPLAVVAALAALAVAPAAASAQTLVGERFESGGHTESYTYDGVCNPDGPSTYYYASFGSATGPVPGLYNQYGSFTLASPSGPVVAYDAQFDVYGNDADVVGTKALAGEGTGTCTPGTREFDVSIPATYSVAEPFAETGPASVRMVGLDSFGTLVATFGPPPPSKPTRKQDCMDGRWADYGFRNQGQCIKAVDDKSGRP
jgi:hypothetical protein